jgi:TonB C terminal
MSEPEIKPETDTYGNGTSVVIIGVLVTIAVHAGVLGAMWLVRQHEAVTQPQLLGAFVDAQLVKFGKPRDLTFLPHKDGVVKNTVQKAEIKIAKDENAPVSTEKDDKSKVDPLKKTHAEEFKDLVDQDKPEAVVEEGGSLKGSRAGTADEAKGDPYILDLIDKIGSAWQTPTTLRDEQLKDLSADVCLTIDADGAIKGYSFVRKSGNSQFDSSLEATLGTLKNVSPPPDRWRDRAARGRLCPSFQKI